MREASGRLSTVTAAIVPDTCIYSFHGDRAGRGDLRVRDRAHGGPLADPHLRPRARARRHPHDPVLGARATARGGAAPADAPGRAPGDVPDDPGPWPGP